MQFPSGTATHPTKVRRARFWLSALLVFANILLVAGLGIHYTARAASEIVVTSLNDDGPGSLRQAIVDASSGDTITLQASGTILLTSGELRVSKDVIINGPGVNTLSISAARQSRIISNSADVTITGVTLRDGEVGPNQGGAILNNDNATLQISNVRFTGNRANSGGAIFNRPGGSVTVIDSTFAGNQTSLTTDSNGGGIYNSAPNGTLVVSNSTFVENTIHDDGSGIYNEASAIIINSTFAFNQAGTAAVVSTGDIQLNNVTITANNGRKRASGLLVLSGGSTVQNSIIAANTTSGNSAQPDCSGDITSGGHNLFGNATGCRLAISEGDLLGDNDLPILPQLGPLSDNGGATTTMLPLPGSPAIDAGSPTQPGTGGSSCEAVDQRGLQRPTAGISGSLRCDIGASEADAVFANPIPVVYTLSQDSVGVQQPANITITGNGFVPGSLIYVQDTPRTTNIIAADQLMTTLSDVDVAAAGSLKLTVVNPAPGGGSSNALTLNVVDLVPPPPPLPTTIPEPTAIPPAPTAQPTFGVSAIAPTSGFVGDAVTISGVGFMSVASVSFNGVAASSFSIVDDATLIAIVPDGATSGPITISTATNSTSSEVFTLNATLPAPSEPTAVPLPTATPAPPPSIGSISPAMGNAGDTITISGASFTGATSVTFNGLAASSFSVVNDTTLLAVVPVNATNGPIVITTASGSASGVAFISLVPHACTVTLQVPALAGGQTYWFQLMTHAAGPISASWVIPAAQSSQLLLYANNPFANLANPVSRGPVGKPIASQNTANTTNFNLTTMPSSVMPGVYTVQFFNSGHSFGGSIGSISYYSDGSGCPSSVTGNSIP